MVAVLEAPVSKVLLSMAGPISLGMLSTFLFQVVDTWFVGQLGPQALAALAFAATAYFFLVAVMMGLAVGVSALVGQALGAGDDPRARRLVGIAACFALVATGATGLLGVWTIEPVFSALGAPPDLLPAITAYIQPLYLGMPLLAVGLVGGAALRATGSTAPPALIMGIAGVINLVLDWALIFGIGPIPALGIQGAAWATVGSWIFVLLGIGALVIRRRLVTARIARPGADLRALIRLSTPAIVTQVMLPLTAMFVTWLLARFGPEAVAAFGVVQRIETLALVGISAVTLAVVPFVAQNFGAGLHDRLSQAIVFVGRTAVYWGSATCVLLMLLGRPIAGLFTDDPVIIDHATTYFRVVGWSFPAFGLLSMAAAVFNGVQKTGRALQVLLVKSLLFTVPVAFIGAAFGVIWVFLALAIGNLLGAIYAGRVLHRSLAEARAAPSPATVYGDDLRRLVLGRRPPSDSADI